jgi:hypothetical protein
MLILGGFFMSKYWEIQAKRVYAKSKRPGDLKLVSGMSAEVLINTGTHALLNYLECLRPFVA